MNEKIKEIGDSLRQRRREMNLSLKEAENATSIRINYLQAIEDGEMEKLISPVYAQGFLKQYAGFLGVDGDQIVRDNQELFVRSDNQEFDYGIGTLETRGHPGGGVKWLPNVVWIGAFLLVVLVAWYTARFFEVI